MILPTHTPPILITGATGLIGSQLVRRYLKAGRTVSALRRAASTTGLLDDVKDQITWLEGDILDIPSLEDAIQPGMDVIHTAAIVSFVPRDRAQMEKINVEGTANIVNVCLDKKVRKLGFISSVAALGRPDPKRNSGSETVVIDENQKWEDSPNNSAYAQTKYRAELEVWRGVAEGLDAVIVNPSVVLGEGDWSRSSSQLFRYVYQEKPFYTEGMTNVVDVQDVAEALYQLMESNIVNERYILNGATLSYKDLFYKMADAFGKKPPAYRVAPALAEVLWRLEALRSRISGKAPLITRETARSATQSYHYVSDKIQRDLTFRFHSVDETIRRVSAFFAGV
jgi:dihydroflavonol-4-reductase